MNFFVETKNKPVTLALTVNTKSEQEIRIVVEDPTKPDTQFTNRVGKVNGTRVFKVRMPDNAEKVLVHVFNKVHGAAPDQYRIVNGRPQKINESQSDPTFWVSKVAEEKLLTARNKYRRNDPNIKEGLKFFRWFSNRAGFLSAGPSMPPTKEGQPRGGSVYRSEHGKFTIQYVDVIIDWNEFLYDDDGNATGHNPKYGQELVTPARINWGTGIIQVSKKHFKQYTVPERLIILLHEFAHKYLSKDIRNEVEADLNGALIYLCEGYPRIEAFKAFYVVFDHADTAQNRERKEKLESFVDDFEQKEGKQAA